MINIELTKEDINNLLIIIGNTAIKGSEAQAIVNLQMKLNSALHGFAPVEETKHD